MLQGKGWEYQLYPLALFCCALGPGAPRSRGAGADGPRPFDLFGRSSARGALAIFAVTVLVLGAKGVDALDEPWIADKARRVAAITRDLGRSLRPAPPCR